jgi:hypothetical protein
MHHLYLIHALQLISFNAFTLFLTESITFPVSTIEVHFVIRSVNQPDVSGNLVPQALLPSSHSNPS